MAVSRRCQDSKEKVLLYQLVKLTELFSMLVTAIVLCLCFNEEPTQTSATTPATFNKMALGNQHLSNCLAIIIPPCPHSSILWKYAAAGPEATPLKFTRRI